MSNRSLYMFAMVWIVSFSAFSCNEQMNEETHPQVEPASSLSEEMIGKDGAAMVLIPAGIFMMGDEKDPDERPVHSVYLNAYYIDIYEVTNAQYAKFMNESGIMVPPAGHPKMTLGDRNCLQLDPDGKVIVKPGYENKPFSSTSWYAAAAYAQFYSKRLPTEAEWEKAARGGLIGKEYPWGKNITHDDANYKGVSGKDEWDDEAAPVGSFSHNGYGLFDMAGNVMEWVADMYDENYYRASPDNNPKGPGLVIEFRNNDFTYISTYRVVRGGAWDDEASRLRVANRAYTDPANYIRTCGFRCVQDAIP